MHRLALLAATLLVPVAVAQEGRAPAFELEPARLSLRVDATAWYMGPGGMVDMPSTDTLGDAASLRIGFLGYDTPSIVAAPEFHVTWGERWRVTARGYYFSDEHEAVLPFAGQVGGIFFDEGTSLASSYSFGSYEAEVGYRVYEFPAELADDPGRKFFGSVEVVGGVRVFDIAWNIARTDEGGFPGVTSAGADEVFVQPLVGARMRLDFTEELGLDVQINIAGLPLGEGSNLSGDIMVGGWWYPWRNVGVQIGYRAASYDLGTGESAEDFTFSGWNQGLQFGVVVQF